MKKFLLFYILGLLCVETLNAQSSINSQQEVPTTYEGWLKKGIQQARNKEFKTAVTSFTECLKLKANTARIYLLRAEANLSALDTFAAKNDYLEMIKVATAKDSATFLKANFLMRIGKFSEAFEDYNSVITSSPAMITCWANRGFCFMNMKNYAKAIEDFNYIFSKNSNHLNSIKARAEAYCKFGNSQKAWEDEYKIYEMGHYVTTPCSKWITENEQGSNIFLYKTKEHMFGFVSNTGKIIVPATYKMANEFVEGFAAVCKEIKGKDYWGFIDATGKEVIACQYGKVYDFSEGLAMVSDSNTFNGKFGFINYAGKEIIAQKHQINNRSLKQGFFEGVAIVVQNFKCGAINKKGEIIIPFNFSEISNFSEGLATASEGYESIKSIINHKAEKIHTSSYKHIDNFYEGLASVSTDFVGIGGIRSGNNKEGFIDRNGKTIVNPQYSIAYDFNDGLAAVRNASLSLDFNNYGFINNMGKVVIPFAYKAVSSFSNGLAKVTTKDDKSFFIDKTGNKVFDIENVSEYTWVQFKNGFAKIEHRDGTYSLVDKTGKIVVKIN